MISGDIDLTEKLDFRRTVKKEIPQLPANWKENKNKLNYTINDDRMYMTVDYNNGYTYTVNLTDTISNITYYYDDTSIIDRWFISDYQFVLSPSTTSTTTSNSITWSGISQKEPERDIFGNIKEYPEEIPKIPWGKKSKEYIKPIPWNYKHKRAWAYYEYNRRIPWEEEDTDDELFRIGDNDRISRIRNSIAWLADKTASFINNYLDQNDEVDLSYLTNMSWIRISDAVID